MELGSVDCPQRASAAGRLLAERHVHAVAFAAASWFEDYLVLDLLEECSLPVLLWALPGMETGPVRLPQLTAFLKQIDVRYRGVYGALERGDPCDRAGEFLCAAALRAKLRRARIGILGHRVCGMSEMAAQEFALKKALGPRMAPLDLPRFLARVSRYPGRPSPKRLANLGGPQRGVQRGRATKGSRP